MICKEGLNIISEKQKTHFGKILLILKYLFLLIHLDRCLIVFIRFWVTTGKYTSICTISCWISTVS